MSVSRNNELLRVNKSYSTKMLFYFVSIVLGSLQKACFFLGLEFNHFISIARKKRDTMYLSFFLVRETGIEPVRFSPHAPQTCASASSATPACRRDCDNVIIILFFIKMSIPFLKFLSKNLQFSSFFSLCNFKDAQIRRKNIKNQRKKPKSVVLSMM